MHVCSHWHKLKTAVVNVISNNCAMSSQIDFCEWGQYQQGDHNIYVLKWRSALLKNPSTISGEEAPTELALYVIDYMPSPSLCGLLSVLSLSCITPQSTYSPALHSPSFFFPLSINTLWPQSPLSAQFIMYTLHVVHISSHYTSERRRGLFSL